MIVDHSEYPVLVERCLLIFDASYHTYRNYLFINLLPVTNPGQHYGLYINKYLISNLTRLEFDDYVASRETTGRQVNIFDAPVVSQ